MSHWITAIVQPIALSHIYTSQWQHKLDNTVRYQCLNWHNICTDQHICIIMDDNSNDMHVIRKLKIIQVTITCRLTDRWTWRKERLAQPWATSWEIHGNASKIGVQTVRHKPNDYPIDRSVTECSPGSTAVLMLPYCSGLYIVTMMWRAPCTITRRRVGASE